MRKVRPVRAVWKWNEYFEWASERPKAWRLDRPTDRETPWPTANTGNELQHFRIFTMQVDTFTAERAVQGSRGQSRGTHSQDLSLTWRQLAIEKKGGVKRTQSCHWHIRRHSGGGWPGEYAEVEAWFAWQHSQIWHCNFTLHLTFDKWL